MTTQTFFRFALILGALTGCETGTRPDDDAGFDFPDTSAGDAGERDAYVPPLECTTAGRTLGNTCVRDAECNDGCYCNGVELCMEGTCVLGLDPCAVPSCASATCDEGTAACAFTTDDTLCDDGDPCDGVEHCDVRTGCRNGPPPTCNDANICTIDYCDPAVGCVYELIDGDGDGAASRTCGGADCNDSNPNVAPGLAEVCNNTVDDNCDSRIDIDDPSCSPTNDTCATAVDITPAGLGTFRTRGATTGFAANYTLSCPSSTSDTRQSGPDAVYSLHLDAMRDVIIGVEGAAYNAAIMLREATTCTSGPDLKCVAPSSSTTEPRLIRRRLPAGDYVVIVKTRTPLVFTLALTLADPSPTQSDICASDTLDISAGGTFTGSFDNHDYYMGCHSTSSQYYDAAFRLVVPPGEARDVRLTATTRLLSGSSSTPYVQLTSVCGSDAGAVSECDAGTTTMPAEVFVRGLAEGEYWVLVENSSTVTATGGGSFELVADIRPAMGRAAGDSCDPGVPVVVTEATPGTIDLAPLDATRDAGEFCAANRAGYRDGFFTFDLSAERDVVVRTTSTERHWVGLSSTCGTVASLADCMASASGVATRRFVRVPAGTHFLNVSTLATSGTITAELTTFPPTPVPPNDACTGAAPLTDGTTTDLDLSLYTDTADYACGGTDALDAYYT
ncbi:MAG: putative metal-binding motif-containing protein, partial [Sandaracinaceae bacterium]|nr:putative metal-binding motif-containing protein [Sandaracinaceae bacterium]